MTIRKGIAGATMVLFLASAPTLLAHDDKGKGKLKSNFTKLDVNNSGLIELSEWRGDRTKFDRLDTDRNGVLSLSELQTRGRKNGKRVVGSMDRDGNGMITRGEWTGSEQSFRRLDRNGDNVLSGAELRKQRHGKRNDDDDDNEDDNQRGARD